jgi:hypothetical protein
MIPIHTLLDRNAIDDWVRSVHAHFTTMLRNPSAPTGDCQWLIDRCTDTLGYDDPYQRYRSMVSLIADIESREAEFPEWFARELAAPARARLETAERRRSLNG